MSHEGLGDSVEAILTKLGISQAVKNHYARKGKDCKCEKRKKALNKAVPYKNNKS